MVDYLGLIVLLILLALFVFLLVRSLRARRAGLKWVGTILFGLLSLVIAAAFVLAVIGTYKLSVPKYSYPPVQDVKVAMTPEQIAKGERYANLCADCHSSKGGGNLPLDGGPNFIEGGPPMGEIHPSNLTPGGELKDWSDGDIIRAIREGVHKSGRSLIIMPSMAFSKMSDEDVHAMVAYLRSQPAVENNLPANHLNVLGAIMTGVGMLPPEVLSAQAPITAPITAPPVGTAEYGDYLASAIGCRDCHGPKLAGTLPGEGGPGGGSDVLAANLTQLVPKWTEEQFIQTIRTGTDPGGHNLSAEAMPWKSYAKALTDEELKSLFLFMHGLNPLAQGTK